MFGNSYGNDNKGNDAPIQEGGEYDVKIDDTGRDGDGIARIDGFVVFVSGAKVGDEVKIRVNSVRRNFAPDTNTTKPSIRAIPSPSLPVSSILTSYSPPSFIGASFPLSFP